MFDMLYIEGRITYLSTILKSNGLKVQKQIQNT